MLWLLRLIAARRGRRTFPDFTPLSSVFTAFVATAIFLLAYWFNDIRPGASNETGWFSWWDQSRYLLMARDFSGLALPTTNYWYGIGYPLVAAPFVKLFPSNPFLIPNLLMYCVAVLLYHRIASKYLDPLLVLPALLLTMLGTQFTEYFVVPWNNTVPAFGLAVLLYIALVVEDLKTYHAVLIGVVLGWVFASRYVDVLFLLPVAGYVFYRRFRADGSLKPNSAFFALAACTVSFMIFLFVLYTHKNAFGDYFSTPYKFHMQAGGHSDQSFSAFKLWRIPDHLYSILINPHQFHGLSYDRLNAPLLAHSFFFIFAPTGFLYSLRVNRAKGGIAVLSGLVLTLVFYGSFTSTNTVNLKFHSLRYFAAWYPILTIIAVLAISRLSLSRKLPIQDGRTLAAGLAATCLVIFSVYAYLALDSWNANRNFIMKSKDWKATASANGLIAFRAVDGRISSKWESVELQRPGQFFELDLGSVRRISGLKMQLEDNPEDYPRGLDIEVSADGVNRQKVLSIPKFLPPADIDCGLYFAFAPVQARFIRLIQTGSSDKYPWMIYELRIRGE